jgi:signal transduction histidine kinase
MIAVADLGKGIPSVERSRVFEKYYRVGSGGEKQVKGTGLGLYIAKRITELLDADIWVEEHKPTGSVFKILFNLNDVS